MVDVWEDDSVGSERLFAVVTFRRKQREPRMKPSEIIEDIYENFMYTSDKDVAPLWGRVYAITRFLDEQHEREESSEERLLGVDTGLPRSIQQK